MSTVQGGQGNIVTSGLVLNLDAANPRSYLPPYNGTTWGDLSRNNNNGTLTNGPTFNTGSGGSIVFDGVDDYVNIPNNSSINISTNQISFGGWFYPTRSGGYQLLIGKSNGAPRQYCMFLSQFSTSQIYVTLNGTNWAQNNVSLSTPWSTNVWNYIILTYNGSAFNIYLNGNTVNTTSATGNITAQNYNVTIGWHPSESYVFKGNIANTQIYNRALSASEVNQNFQATRARFGI